MHRRLSEPTHAQATRPVQTHRPGKYFGSASSSIGQPSWPYFIDKETIRVFKTCRSWTPLTRYSVWCMDWEFYSRSIVLRRILCVQSFTAWCSKRYLALDSYLQGRIFRKYHSGVCRPLSGVKETNGDNDKSYILHDLENQGQTYFFGIFSYLVVNINTSYRRPWFRFKHFLGQEYKKNDMNSKIIDVKISENKINLLIFLQYGCKHDTDLISV